MDSLSASTINFFKSCPTEVIHQSESSECGLACLAMFEGYHGYKTDLTSLRRRFSVSMKGLTLAGLMAIADKISFACRPLRTELSGLDSLGLPAILHWDN
jgi:ATP-binding cassette subfamily B protein RaxB